MTTRLARILACATISLAALAGPAGAQTTPRPTPTPAPTPVAFSAHAHANLTVTTANGPLAGTVALALAQRADQTRIDVLSVKSDTFPLPPISLTVVVDRAANTVTGWSDTTRQYRVQSLLPRTAASASPAPAASRPPRAGTSLLSKLDVLVMTMRLTGHTTTLGFPSTGLSFDMQVQHRGEKAASHVTATTQLADEFAAFPLAIDLAVEPGASPVAVKLAYAVDDLTRGAPAATRFAIPAGYTEAPSWREVVFPRR